MQTWSRSRMFNAPSLIMSQIGYECFPSLRGPKFRQIYTGNRGYYQPWELKHSSPGLLSLENLSLNPYGSSFGNHPCPNSALAQNSWSEQPLHQKQSNSRTSAGQGELCEQLKPHSPAPCLHGGWSSLAWKKNTKFLQQQMQRVTSRPGSRSVTRQAFAWRQAVAKTMS